MAELADIIAGYRGGDAVWWWQWRKLAAQGGVGEARALLEAMAHQGDAAGWRRPLGCLLRMVPRAGAAALFADEATLDTLAHLLRRLRWDEADGALWSPRELVDGLAWLTTVAGSAMVPRLWTLLLGPPLPLVRLTGSLAAALTFRWAGAKTLALAHLRPHLQPDDAAPLLDLAVRPAEPGLVRSAAATLRFSLLAATGPAAAAPASEWTQTFWTESTGAIAARRSCLKGWLLEHASEPTGLTLGASAEAAATWVGDLVALLPDERARARLLVQVHELLPQLGDADAGHRAAARRCLLAAGAEAVAPLREYLVATTDWTTAESTRQALRALDPHAPVSLAALADTPEARERRCEALLNVAAGGTALLAGDLETLHRHGTAHHAVRLLQIAGGSRRAAWDVLVGAARIIARRVDVGELLQHPAGPTAAVAALRTLPADSASPDLRPAVRVAAGFVQDLLLAAGPEVRVGLRALLDGPALPAAHGSSSAAPAAELGAKPMALSLLAPQLTAADAPWLRRLAQRPDEPVATRGWAARLALASEGEQARLDVLRPLLAANPQPTVTAVTAALLVEAAEPDPPGHLEAWLADLLRLGLADAAHAPWLDVLARQLVPYLGHANVKARLLARRLLAAMRHLAVPPLVAAVVDSAQWQERQNAAELLGSLDPLALARAQAERDGPVRGLSRAAGPQADAVRGLSAAGGDDG